MEITANKLNIDEINANNGLTGLKLAGFTVTDTSLYNLKESLASNDIGCYIGTDGIAYSGSERHFKVNSSGDVVSDAIYSSDGVQLLCHNTSFTSNPNGNVVLAYGNANETNIYGNIIRLIPSPDETDYNYFIVIQKGLIAPYLDSTYNLGNATHKWSKIYCDELICTTVTSENGGSSSGGSGGASSGDTLSNIVITDNSALYGGTLWLGQKNNDYYFINSDANAGFNEVTINKLTATNLTVTNPLSNIVITNSDNALYGGTLWLGQKYNDYYFINSDANAGFNEVTINKLTATNLTVTNPLSNIVITNSDNALYGGTLWLGDKNNDYYFINSNANAGFNEVTINKLTATNLTVTNPLSNIVITNSDNALLSGTLWLGQKYNDYYFINSDANAGFNEVTINKLNQNSSKRFKENINYKDNTYWHDKLMGIKPCTFNYKNNKKERIGVIAEDLYETFPELVQKDSDGLVSSVSYVDMIIPLVSEVQRLNNVVTKQQNEINELKSLIS